MDADNIRYADIDAGMAPACPLDNSGYVPRHMRSLLHKEGHDDDPLRMVMHTMLNGAGKVRLSELEERRRHDFMDPALLHVPGKPACRVLLPAFFAPMT